MMSILALMLLISTGVGAIRDKVRKIRRKQEEDIMKLRKDKCVESRANPTAPPPQTTTAHSPAAPDHHSPAAPDHHSHCLTHSPPHCRYYHQTRGESAAEVAR